MKLRLLVGRAGIGFAQNPGEEIETSEAEGARLIAAGQAVEIGAAEAPPAPKKTARRKRETAAKPAPDAETREGGA